MGWGDSPGSDNYAKTAGNPKLFKSETEVEQALREAATNGAHAIEGIDKRAHHALEKIRDILKEEQPCWYAIRRVQDILTWALK